MNLGDRCAGTSLMGFTSVLNHPAQISLAPDSFTVHILHLIEQLLIKRAHVCASNGDSDKSVFRDVSQTTELGSQSMG